MYDDFFAFARKRHQIYLDRKAGKPSPWTDDPILQQYSFTNVFRELDKTTVWFRENVRDKYNHTDNVLMATVVFRLFNRMITGEAIFCQTTAHPVSGEPITPFELFLKTGVADVMRDSIISLCGKGPYCTGSYIINSPNGMDKLTGVLQMIQWVWDGLDPVLEAVKHDNSLESVWEQLCKFPHIAAFTSYEIVTDLRHTHLLDRAPDIFTWANPGPGAMRGLNRIHGRPLNGKGDKQKFIDEMQVIMREAHTSIQWPVNISDGLEEPHYVLNNIGRVGGDWPMWEMRDVEHTLCEFDKYTRTKQGEGRPRGRFKST